MSLDQHGKLKVAGHGDRYCKSVLQEDCMEVLLIPNGSDDETTIRHKI